MRRFILTVMLVLGVAVSAPGFAAASPPPAVSPSHGGHVRDDGQVQGWIQAPIFFDTEAECAAHGKRGVPQSWENYDCRYRNGEWELWVYNSSGVTDGGWRFLAAYHTYTRCLREGFVLVNTGAMEFKCTREHGTHRWHLWGLYPR
ncbi:hypothetical protein ALI144C_04010 [Actinosynnema sp. ALI-1.44]|uniref:hypothetical protein n=1 Tax=Actinosynnema sp. ALI-1.44 TaxID=1933779 RepID=UPI00097C4DCC|nr:hypothetical protein [Actinosynnema sp. ALI-1.44]ONI89863.1 hypothetical protein ALI144C_04010 [Actinosynnema sp. ALI-1.44]